MNFTTIDLGGLVLATLGTGVLLVLPGYAAARIFGLTRRGETETDWLTAIVMGLAVLPLADSFGVRFAGLDATLRGSVALALVALAFALRSGSIARPRILGVALIACWFVLLAVEWVDFDVAGKLFQPLTAIDTVKHAATAQAISDSGAPPRDAFFLRPERASYYYFFYTIPALVLRACGGLVDAKAAVGGMAFWTGVGVYGLIRLVAARIGVRLTERLRPLLVVAVLAAGGLDILAAVFVVLVCGYWLADPLQWNEEPAAWFENLLWVPHHVTAMIAGTLGLVTLCDGMDEPGELTPSRRSAGRTVVLAGFCFASMLGLSVWVTLGYVLSVAAWAAILLVERRWRPLVLVLAAGLFAFIVAFPHILDLKAGRVGDGVVPIAAMVRPFRLVELTIPQGPWQTVADFVALPLNYAFEFGVLALGSLVYWRQRTLRHETSDEFSRVLVIAAVAGLLAGGFLRSTLFNDDLGWRVLLLPLLTGTVWTIAALDHILSNGGAIRSRSASLVKPAFVVLFVLGWSTVVEIAISMRAYPFMTINPGARFIARDPATERALRVAYGWAAQFLSASAVVQQNPTRRRVLAFGLYGRDQIAIADTFGSLYGADPRAVAERLDNLAPIFKTSLTMADVVERARAAGIDDLIVTIADPVWTSKSGFVAEATPVYISDRVRIIAVPKRASLARDQAHEGRG